MSKKLGFNQLEEGIKDGDNRITDKRIKKKKCC